MSRELRTGRHCTFLMHVHLVFVTKYRRDIFTKSILNDLESIFLRYVLKGASSQIIRRKGYKTIQQALWGGSLWSRSYFAGSCGGAPINVIKKYIEQQNTPT